MERTLRQDMPRLVMVGCLYLGAFGYASLFVDMPGEVTPVWPAAGIGLASILLYGYRATIPLAIGAALGQIFFSWQQLYLLPFTVSANVFAPLLAAWMLRTYGPVDLLSVRVRNTFGLLVGGMWLAVVSASIGSLGLCISGDVPWPNYFNAWQLWAVGDFFGAMICTPTMVCVVLSLRRFRDGDRRVLRAPSPEIYIWLMSYVALGCFSWWLGRHSSYVLAISNLPLALFLWSAFRFPPIYTYGSVTVTLLGGLLLGGVGLPGMPAPTTPVDTAILVLFFSSMAILPQLVTATSFERQYFESKLVYRANHDRLTGLRNRSAFEEHASAVLEESSHTQEPVAMAYLDLDRFKVVNDTCGHSVGDHLICQITAVLENNLHPGDILARMGGDEFAVLFRNCKENEAHSRADTLRHQVDEFRFTWNKRVFAFTLSIGVIPMDPRLEFNKQLSMADTACYQAKEAGRNRIKLAKPGDLDITRHHDESEWVVRINEALEHDHFRLYCQPIVPVSGKNDDYNHFEVLVRMIDDRGNVLLPGTFVPAAERFHLMSKVDQWVVEHTLDWLDQHPKAKASTSLCSINLSGPSLCDNSFHKFLKRMVHEHGVPPEKICFEVTETAAIGDMSRANRFIKSMRREGCHFALDDFGSGLASFGYLKTLNVDYLKIDGAFVRDIARAPIDLAMVKSINEVGHVMGKKTIAEFVESEEVSEALRTLGVDYAQGHAVGKPVPIEEYFANTIVSNQRAHAG